MTRYVRNSKGDFIAQYEVLENEERELFVNGEKVAPNTRFSIEEQKQIDNLCDDFEEGFNEVNYSGNYEFLTFGKFEIRRKIGGITVFDAK